MLVTALRSYFCCVRLLPSFGKLLRGLLVRPYDHKW
jgi:hypothetical protein